MRIAIAVLLVVLLNSCSVYTFSGASTTAKTATVHYIANQAPIVVPTLSNTLTEKLKNKILTNSAVAVIDNNGELDFSGTITGYSVSPIAAQANQTAAKNRLTVTVSIDFKDTKNEKNNWTQSFSRFSDFDSSQNLNAVQNALIDDITNQIVQDIFNKALVIGSMDKSALIKLIDNPNTVNTIDVKELEALTQQFPWFSTAHLLLTRKYQLSNPKELEQRLVYTSAFANDRQALYHLLYEVPTAKEASVQEKVKEEISVLSVAENFDQVETEAVEIIEEGKSAEVEAVQHIEETLEQEKETVLNEEFQLMAESGSMAELSQKEVNEDSEEEWLEEKDEPEAEAIQEIEQQLVRRELHETGKESALNSISQSEFNHKNEEQEPDDDRFFEEKFDTEMESVKLIDAGTMEFKKNEEAFVSPESILASETIEKEEYVAEQITNAGEILTFSAWLKRFKGSSTQPVVKKTEAPKVIVSNPPSSPVTEKVVPPSASPQQTWSKDETVTVEFTHDYLSTDVEEDLKTIDRFVESIKEKQDLGDEKEVSIQNLAIKSILEEGEIVSETLAKIYELQGKYQRAIQTYEKLSLNFPDKSAYFAALIQGLKNKL